MYCTQCGTYFSGTGDKCPSCNAAEQSLNTKQSFWDHIDKKRLCVAICILLCIILLVRCGISMYNNSGSYEIKNYNGSYQKIEYRGTLQQLVSDDYSLVDDFFNGDVDGKNNVRAIYCNDYTLEWVGYGYGGTIDLLEENITFYEWGLHEYNQYTYTGDYFDRFRDDFMFIIEKKSNSHQYYFQSALDVSKWLKQNF